MLIISTDSIASNFGQSSRNESLVNLFIDVRFICSIWCVPIVCRWVFSFWINTQEENIKQWDWTSENPSNGGCLCADSQPVWDTLSPMTPWTPEFSFNLFTFANLVFPESQNVFTFFLPLEGWRVDWQMCAPWCFSLDDFREVAALSFFYLIIIMDWFFSRAFRDTQSAFHVIHYSFTLHSHTGGVNLPL